MLRKTVSAIILLGILSLSVFISIVPNVKAESTVPVVASSTAKESSSLRVLQPIENVQPKITESRMTNSELQQLKSLIGIYEGNQTYDQITDGHGTGLAPPSDADWKKIYSEANVITQVSSPTSSPLPSEVDNSATPWFPPIGNQGSQGSCVAWAVGYYVKTFQEAKEHGWNVSAGTANETMSPSFIYNLIDGGVDNGSSYYNAINLVCSIGDCSLANMPYNAADCTSWPSEKAWSEASQYRANASSFSYLMLQDDAGLASLKAWLSSSNLAIVSVDASKIADPFWGWSRLDSNDMLTLDNYVNPSPNHAGTIVGYNDDFAYTEQGQTHYGAFKVANSWGIGGFMGWENVPDGCYWISYATMEQRVGSCMVYRDRTGYVPTLNCSFRIDHPVSGNLNILIGVGTHDNPTVSKSFSQYIRGGNRPFCANNVVFDISEFTSTISNVYGQTFFLSVYDVGNTTAGNILYFSVLCTVSPNPPVPAVNRSYVYADLILVDPLHWWPMFHQNSEHTGYSSSLAPETNQTAWIFVTGRYGDLSWSSPVVAEGTVFAGVANWPQMNKGSVVALNDSTGSLIWLREIDEQVAVSLAVSDGRIFFNVYGGAYALNETTGEIIWFNSAVAGSTWTSWPTISNGEALFGSGNSIYALSETNGSIFWTYTFGDMAFSSPTVDGDRIFIGSRDHYVYSLNSSSGQLLWRFLTGNMIESSPAVTDGKVIFGSFDGNVYALNENSGALIWEYPTGYVIQSSPSVHNGVIFIGTVYGLISLNESNGAIVWQASIGVVGLSSPAIADDKVFVGNRQGLFYALNETTGETIWSSSIEFDFYTSPAVADGKVFITTHMSYGRVYAFGSFEPLAPVPESTLTVLSSPVNATFNAVAFNTTVQSSWSIYNSTPWTQRFAQGSSLDVYAPISHEGYLFNHWELDGVNIGANYIIDVAMDKDHTILAIFDGPHDIAVTDVTPSKTVIGRGYPMRTVVTVVNQGNLTETFNVTVYANTTYVAFQNVTLSRLNSTDVTFMWDTTGFAYGNYTIDAFASPVPGEANTTNNYMNGGTVCVGIPGDVNGDGRVNILDYILVSNAFLSTFAPPSSSNWNPNADINGDNVVNILDAIILSNHFLQHYP